MREQLTKYVDLLFAGAPDSADIKQEILQNTLDRYDDLISQGKTPEAAYQLAISGIGDINEILSGRQQSSRAISPEASPEIPEDKKTGKWAKAAAICLFILCPIPVLIIHNVLGVCLLLAMIAAGVALLTVYGKDSSDHIEAEEPKRSALNRGITGCIWTIGLCAYFLVSFSTGAWHITWVIFPMLGCICGLIDAIFDLHKSTASAIIRMIVNLLLIAILASTFFAVYFGFNFLSRIEYSTTDGTVESVGNISAEAVRDIKIEWVSGSITIEPADIDTISFAETPGLKEEDKMIWKHSGDTLTIQFSKPKTFTIFSFGTDVSIAKDLVIKVPRQWICDELSIESVSAEIIVSNISASDINLDNVSGKCTFTDCIVNSLSSETVSGSVEYCGQLNELDMNSVSAACSAKLSTNPRNIQLECVSGDLTLYLPESCGFTVSHDAISGDFSSEYSTSVSNGDYIYGDGSCRIDAEGISGNISIRKFN